MDFPVQLFINALIAGILLGGFYAAVTVGISISFGILDIVNIAHPAFIILGSYIAYIANQRLGLDPILTSILVLPAFYYLGSLVYQVYYLSFEKRGQEALRGLAFFFGLLFVTEVALILVFGVDYRYVQAGYIDTTLRFGFFDLPLRMVVPFVISMLMLGGLQLFLSKTFTGRAIMAVAQDQLALSLMAADPDPHQAHRLCDLDRDRVRCRRAPDRHPAGRAFGRPRIYRPRLRHLRARRHGQPARHRHRRAAARHRGKPHLDLLRPVLGAGGRLRLPVADARRAALRNSGTIARAHLAILSRLAWRSRWSASLPRACCRTTICSSRAMWCCNSSCWRPPGTSLAAIAAT